MDKSYFDPQEFRKVSEEALVPAAEYIRGAILGEVDLSGYLVKGDKTAVTVVDRRSQEISRPVIQRAFPQYRLNQEESEEESGNNDSPIVLYHDPLDGTGGFLMGGATPTIILAAYDSSRKEILACSTMEPSTGRFWFSSIEGGTLLKRFDYDSENFDSEEGRPLSVNSKEGLNGSHVLIDVDHGFERKTIYEEKRQILTSEGRRGISRAIEGTGGKIASFYTNGGHYAYVATGRPTLVGCITTAIGGPFDVAGLRHVLEAGGAAQCYRINEERNLLAINSQDIEEADIVIATNNIGNLSALEDITKQSVHL
ncbi:MAG: inositol monophosphatase family protein [Nanoarchaeota archaeon]|nr:inositol monophosphatase family protein [Nanoarchaeota archaeon]